jgi:hypothetical protein
MSNINQDSKYARGIPGFRVRPQHLVAPDPLITAPPPVTTLIAGPPPHLLSSVSSPNPLITDANLSVSFAAPNSVENVTAVVAVNGSGGDMEYKETVDSVDRVMEGMVETVTDYAFDEMVIKMEWLRSNLQDLPVDSVLQLATDVISLVAGGAADFSVVDGVSSLKPAAVPVELHVSSTVAGDAADFSAVDGVSSLKPATVPVELHVSSTVAGGAADFSAVDGVVVLYKKTDAQTNRDKRKRKRNRENKKKKRREALSVITPINLEENPRKGMSLCVFHQRGYNSWCARGYYDCGCCEGATLNFRTCIVKLRLV